MRPGKRNSSRRRESDRKHDPRITATGSSDEVQKQKEKIDQQLDKALECTFPASDPVSVNRPSR